MPHPATLGVVLAGGHARRLGGGDKVRIRIGGKTMLERVLARLAPQCSPLILNANGDAARFADTGLAVVADSVPDHAGPLAGILAGLEWAVAHAPELAWVVSAPGDCPFLPTDLVERLHRARADADKPLACARSGGRLHPATALWPTALREDLRRALAHDGMRKVDHWTARYGVGVAEWAAAPVDPFFNVNTPDDVAAAERLAARYPAI